MDKLNVYQKINEVKKVIKSFNKDASTSGKGAYSYTSGTQVLSAIKEKMEEIGLLFLPVKTEHRGYQTYNYKNSYGDEKTDFIVDGKLFYEWIDIDNPTDRQKVEFEYYGQQNDVSKAFGSALTYSERYILLKSLGVPTDEDDPDKKNENKTQNYKTDKKPKNEPLKEDSKKEMTLADAMQMSAKRGEETVSFKDMTTEDLIKLRDNPGIKDDWKKASALIIEFRVKEVQNNVEINTNA